MIARLGKARFIVCAALVLVLIAAVIAVGADGLKLPQATGKSVKKDGKLTVDASNMSEGYIMVKAKKTSKKLRVRVSTAGAKLLYWLNGDGEYEVYPLQFGSGKYQVSLYENAGGKKYSKEGSVKLNVDMPDKLSCFLYPNQYVNYTRLSEAVAKSDELAAAQSQTDIYNAVCNFMASEFSYDFVRAASISPGELPEVDGCFASRTGICQDLSAVTACMLRVQGIPARLMIGYADKYYHAWITAIVDGEEVFFDPTAAINALNAKKYTVERYY